MAGVPLIRRGYRRATFPRRGKAFWSSTAPCLPPWGKVPPQGADEGRRPLLLTRAHEVRPYSILEQNPYRIFLATATP